MVGRGFIKVILNSFFDNIGAIFSIFLNICLWVIVSFIIIIFDLPSVSAYWSELQSFPSVSLSGFFILNGLKM